MLKSPFWIIQMRGKLYHDVSARSLQVILNQLLGLAIFYISCRWLSKELFGELNWCIAVSTIAISVMSMGLDVLVAKKIALSQSPRQVIELHVLHVTLGSLLMLLILGISCMILPGNYTTNLLLPAITISQVLSFLASPFRQLANGKRLFIQLAIATVGSNLVKLILLALAATNGQLSIRQIIMIFISSAAVELLLAVYFLLKENKTYLPSPRLNWNHYFALVKEGLPQYGVHLFSVILCRFDWIILGIVTGPLQTAEYSFAFRITELSRLPLLVISPILLPVFANIFNNTVLRSKTVLKLQLLFRAEMLLSVTIPVLLISCWTPLVDTLTQNKYGASTEMLFILLALSTPLQYATDYYWNLCFAQHRLKFTFAVTVGAGFLNILLNLLLIPMIGTTGAAIAYIASLTAQLLLFWKFTARQELRIDVSLLPKILVVAAIAVFTTRAILPGSLIGVLVMPALYLLLVLQTRLFRPDRIKPALKILLPR